MPFRLITMAACLCCIAAAPATPNISQLVERLADQSFDVRQEAHRCLVELGPNVLPSLDEALKRSDPEVRRRAGQIIERILADHEVVERARAFRDIIKSRRQIIEAKSGCEVIDVKLPRAEINK